MRKQIEVWEGEVRDGSSFIYGGMAVGEDTIDDIMDSIIALEGKKIRITVEVIE